MQYYCEGFLTLQRLQSCIDPQHPLSFVHVYLRSVKTFYAMDSIGTGWDLLYGFFKTNFYLLQEAGC